MTAQDQLPLAFPASEGLTREHLVDSDANAAAVRLIDGWPAWPSPVVVLVGPAGSGKSHLGAIWRENAGAGRVPAAAIADAAARLAGPATVEDCDRGGLDETGLFHLINAARAGGHALLLTARTRPAAWGVKLADLASRLKAATVVEIEEPDDALLAAVMAKLFADRQVEVEPHVISYLVRRIERSLATAARVVDKLDRAAIARQTRISRALAAEVVSALDEGQPDLPL